MGTADALPPDWRRLCPGGDSHGKARVVADYIAGMTDRFALDEHARLFGSPAPH
jgi:dGTPase